MQRQPIIASAAISGEEKLYRGKFGRRLILAVVYGPLPTLFQVFLVGDVDFYDFLDGAFYICAFELPEECEYFFLWLKLLNFHTLILFLATKVIVASAIFRQFHFFYIPPLFC